METLPVAHSSNSVRHTYLHWLSTIPCSTSLLPYSGVLDPFIDELPAPKASSQILILGKQKLWQSFFLKKERRKKILLSTEIHLFLGVLWIVKIFSFPLPSYPH